MNVQFGCGGNILDGWVNHDMDADVTKLPLPYTDESVDMVLAEHLTEHLDSREAVGFLTDCHRILKTNGVLRICCPAVGPWLERDFARDLLINHGHKMILQEEPMRTLLWASGFELWNIKRTDRWDMDGHWKIIGKPQDDIETCRMYATK